MNFGKRAILYISRKREKTAGLFLLVLVVSIFLISGFEVMEAAGHLSGDIRTSLGAAFYIRASVSVSTAGNGEMQVQSNDTYITQAVIDRIMGLGGIEFCNPINYGFAKSEDIQFIPGDKHNADNNMGRVTALGYSALAPAFSDETVTLLKGDPITPSDSGKILISDQLAEANHLSVGDTVTLTHAKLVERDGGYADEIPVKTAFAEVAVSGIYRIHTEDTAVSPTAGQACNEIYASLDVLETLKESEAGVYTGEVDFYITDPADLEPITRNVQLISDIDWTTHFIRTNDFRFSKIEEQLSSLADLMKILLVCVSVVSAVILTLILSMRMHGRVPEVGMLLSAGISKGQVLGQFLLEVLLVAAAALLLSHIAVSGVTRVIAENVFREMQPHLLNEQVLSGDTDGAGFVSYLHLGAALTAALYAAQILVIVLTILASSVTVMRIKPKEILSKMS
ncbi:MAG: FtsX-like permease family protein [Lachnospiraceae bacterium]|nr:FtsX-like permease family protein [Lachnospiraceae bacterium]